MKIERELICISALFLITSLMAGCSKTEGVDRTSMGDYPIRTVLDLMVPFSEESGTNMNITQHTNVDGNYDKAVVVVVESGFKDDSIAAERTVFNMSRKESKWIIIDEIKTHSCLIGRGHQDFSDKLCH